MTTRKKSNVVPLEPRQMSDEEFYDETEALYIVIDYICGEKNGAVIVGALLNNLKTVLEGAPPDGRKLGAKALRGLAKHISAMGAR